MDEPLAIAPTSASAAAITPVASPSGGTLLLGAGNVHCERAPTELLAVPHVDGGSTLRFGRHLDKTESARAAGHAIGDDRCGNDGTRLRKRVGKFLVRS